MASASILAVDGKCYIGPVGADIADMQEIAVTFTFEQVEPDRVLLAPSVHPVSTETWCRYCGGMLGATNVERSRMICDVCYRTFHPASFQMQSVYYQWSPMLTDQARTGLATWINPA